MSGFDINQLTISGNLTRDPELRNLPSGQSVCNVRIAHNERRKNQSDAWSDVPAYFESLRCWGPGFSMSWSNAGSSMTCWARKTLPCQRNHLTRCSSWPVRAAMSTGGDRGRSGSGGGERRPLAMLAMTVIRIVTWNWR